MKDLVSVFLLSFVLLVSASSVLASDTVFSTTDNLQSVLPDTSGLAVELAAFASLAPEVVQARIDRAELLNKKWLKKYEIRDGEVKQGLIPALGSACFSELMSHTYDLRTGETLNILGMAVADLTEAVGLDPTQVEVRTTLGMVLVNTGNQQTGMVHLLKARQILGPPPPEESSLDATVRYDYLLEKIHYHLAHGYRDYGCWDQALAEIKIGAKIKPSPAWTVLKGLCIAGAGHTSKAISYAVRMPPIKYHHRNSHHDARYAHPSDYANRWIKSQALFASGDVSGARHVLGTLEFNRSGRMPLARRFWQDAGLICELLQDPAALEHYSHVALRSFFSWFYPSDDRLLKPIILGYPDPEVPLFITPDQGFEGGSPFAYIAFQMNLMVGCDDSDDPAKISACARADERALAMCETLLRRHIQPDLVRAFRARVHMFAGRHDLAHPDLEFAQAGFASRDLVDPTTSIMLGQLELLSGNHERSRVLFDEALAVVPDNALAYRELGVALGQAHQYDLAQKAMKKAMELEPDSVEGWFNLGVLSYRQGDHDQALVCLETAWKLRPGDERVQTMLQTVATARRMAVPVE